MRHDPTLDDDDRALLEHYLSIGREPWNTSLESLWLECELRRWTLPRLPARRPLAVCNVGIGVGAWDDWLGHVLGMAITSVDRDPDCCRMLALRQRRERHPHPATVVCGDVLDGVLGAARFDVITVVGSTIREAGDRERFLGAIDRALAADGVALVAEVGDGEPPAAATEIRRLGALWVACQTRMRGATLAR